MVHAVDGSSPFTRRGGAESTTAYRLLGDDGCRSGSGQLKGRRTGFESGKTGLKTDEIKHKAILLISALLTKYRESGEAHSYVNPYFFSYITA